MPGNRKQIYLQHKKYNMNILEHLIAFLAPHTCLMCRQEGALLCADCMADLPVHRIGCGHCAAVHQHYLCPAARRWDALEHVWAATTYGGIARELVHQLKFERAVAATDTIGRGIARIVSDMSGADRLTLVTHAPTASARARQRGYDQAELIARRVARELYLPYASLLARRHDKRQVGQSRVVRSTQAATAFRPLSALRVNGQYVLLIDDVLTTGSTLNAAARILRRSGAEAVSAAVFAAA